jgi:hypothetical protein
MIRFLCFGRGVREAQRPDLVHDLVVDVRNEMDRAVLVLAELNEVAERRYGCSQCLDASRVG